MTKAKEAMTKTIELKGEETSQAILEFEETNKSTEDIMENASRYGIY